MFLNDIKLINFDWFNVAQERPLMWGKIPQFFQNIGAERKYGHMLYTNKTLKIYDKAMKFGSVTGVSIGEEGRGRREVFLPTPAGMEEEITPELHANFTIGTSKSGRPRINKAYDCDLYMVLSSGRSYTRRGNGYIEAPIGQKVEVIARGNGADGDAGRIGSWDATIVKANEGDIFRVTWGGYGYGYPSTFYVVYESQVYEADQPEIEDLYEKLRLEIPFNLIYENGELHIEYDEWVRI